MAIEIVDFPIKSMMIFHSFLYVYQRVYQPSTLRVRQAFVWSKNFLAEVSTPNFFCALRKGQVQPGFEGWWPIGCAVCTTKRMVET